MALKPPGRNTMMMFLALGAKSGWAMRVRAARASIWARARPAKPPPACQRASRRE